MCSNVDWQTIWLYTDVFGLTPITSKDWGDLDSKLLDDGAVAGVDEAAQLALKLGNLEI